MAMEERHGLTRSQRPEGDFARSFFKDVFDKNFTLEESEAADCSV